MAQGPKQVPDVVIEACVRELDQFLAHYDYGQGIISFYAMFWGTGPWFSNPTFQEEIARRYKEAGWKDVVFIEFDPQDHGRSKINLVR